jgi:hypothetical protein
MRICPDHWAALRAAIDARGLTPLVARDARTAHEAIGRSLAGEAAAEDFDPLMNANFAIFAAFLEDAGLAGLIGDVCPLCAVDAGSPGLAADWISGCADDQLAQARWLGLVPVVQ